MVTKYICDSCGIEQATAVNMRKVDGMDLCNDCEMVWNKIRNDTRQLAIKQLKDVSNFQSIKSELMKQRDVNRNCCSSRSIDRELDILFCMSSEYNGVYGCPFFIKDTEECSWSDSPVLIKHKHHCNAHVIAFKIPSKV